MPRLLKDVCGCRCRFVVDMRYFPICLNIVGRRCIVIGGGRVAARKVESLLEHGGRVTVISPELVDELAELARQDRIETAMRSYREGDLAGAFLVIAATDDPEVQRMVHAEAEKNNILLNVADVPRWCNFILPATVRQGDLSISFSTGGKSPALARKLREEFEGRFGPEYAVLLDMLGAIRKEVLADNRCHEENKKLFASILHPELLDWIRKGKYDRVAEHVRSVVGKEIDLACLERTKT